MRKVYVFALLFFIGHYSFGQYSLTGATYSQDFNTLALSGTSSTVPTGWAFNEVGGNTTYTAGTGSSGTGDTYSFGASASSERAFGGIQSGSLNPTIGFYFTNNTGSTITSISFSYMGEQWRSGLTTSDKLDFQYSTNATSLTTGTWSDYNALDFIAPITTGVAGALNGNAPANQTSITSLITGLNIANGATLFIRWNDFDAVGAEDGLSIDDFQINIPASSPTSSDYFRSVQSGDWDNINTWESSVDNASWVPATVPPSSTDQTISIRNGHTVTLVASATIDEVIIENGGVLENQLAGSNILTIADGPGDDIDIQGGGIYHVTSGLGYSNYQTLNSGATVHIENNGIIKVGNGALLGGGSNNSFVTTSTKYIWDNGSIFDWNSTGSPGATSVTYFPDAIASVIPVLRFSATLIGTVGGGGGTLIVNGILEANATVPFSGNTDKTFRNGIRGTGNVSADVSMTTAKFIINGTTAVLGGTGSLTVPSAGLQIGSAGGTAVTVTSTKTVTGNVSLISTNTSVDLGANDLTVSGTISGGGANAYIKTSGAGVLTLSAVTSRSFPIGNASYNPITIASGGGVDYSARVEDGINNPSGAIPADAVLQTWYIKAATTTSGVIVTYQFGNADCSAGALPQPMNMEILESDYLAWSLLAGNTSIMTAGADPAWTVTASAGMTINNSLQPYAVAVSGSLILASDYFITAKAQKTSNGAIIKWDVATCDNVSSFELQRSFNNAAFETVGTINPVNGQLAYYLTDISLPKGTVLYRIRVNRSGGVVRYSNIVAVINDNKGLLITSLAPNPVQDNTTITISSAKHGVITFQLYDLSGAIVKQWQSNVTEGTTTIKLNTTGLPAGVYHLAATGADAKAVFRLVKQ